LKFFEFFFEKWKQSFMIISDYFLLAEGKKWCSG
jgi:hypothetical protein